MIPESVNLYRIRQARGYQHFATISTRIEHIALLPENCCTLLPPKMTPKRGNAKSFAEGNNVPSAEETESLIFHEKLISKIEEQISIILAVLRRSV